MRAAMFPVQRRLLHAVLDAVTADPLLGRLADDAAGLPRLVIESLDCAPWHSLTFAGHRHAIALRLTAPQPVVEEAQARFEALLDGLALPRGDVLIEAAVEEASCALLADGEARLELRMAALTVED